MTADPDGEQHVVYTSLAAADDGRLEPGEYEVVAQREWTQQYPEDLDGLGNRCGQILSVSAHVPM